MKRFVAHCVLFIGLPFTFLAALWLRLVKKLKPGVIEDSIFMNIGVLPVIDHYYEPLINPKKHLVQPLNKDRYLPGIDLNEPAQLELLSRFHYNDELLAIPINKQKDLAYYYNNHSYASGDAEYLYNIVRHFKPRRFFEIGSGFSTLMVRNAVLQNQSEDKEYRIEHVCIEPYEQPWLQKIDIKLIREKVETISPAFFQQLESNDVLFIDSSHIIRPQGDVLFEFLQVLPLINPGVLIHVHDIFTPKDYPVEWIHKHVFWNEQYLLEAFLTLNRDFRIIGALNFLAHHHRALLAEKCPVFAGQPDALPGACWIQRIIT
ncbi:MAG TPA: class I SAM-dependent methyltransferase [Flavitalea sp.]|nr:class I SAM-dependent methyltransferase [Flavitalea sp.]